MHESEYPAYMADYLRLVAGPDILETLKEQAESLPEFYGNIPLEKEDHRYAEGKWSVKEILGHTTDTERIMCYRALCFARNEKQSLPGFEENDYVRESNFSARSLYSLIVEFISVRQASISLFAGMSREMMLRQGKANNHSFSVRALAHNVAGHALHHMQVVQERYLI